MHTTTQAISAFFYGHAAELARPEMTGPTGKAAAVGMTEVEELRRRVIVLESRVIRRDARIACRDAEIQELRERVGNGFRGEVRVFSNSIRDLLM